MATINKIKLPDGTVYDISSSGTVTNATKWNNRIEDFGTENNVDTWLLVVNGQNVQHRTVESILNSKTVTRLYGGVPAINTVIELDISAYKRFIFYGKADNDSWISFTFTTDFILFELPYNERIFVNASAGSFVRDYIFSVNYKSGSSTIIELTCVSSERMYYFSVFGENYL